MNGRLCSPGHACLWIRLKNMRTKFRFLQQSETSENIMHSLNQLVNIISVWSGRAGVLLSGGNWNNGLNAGVSYRNSNNRSSNVNANIGRHLELKASLSGPEQRSNQNQGNLVKYTANRPGVLVLPGRFSRNGGTKP